MYRLDAQALSRALQKVNIVEQSLQEEDAAVNQLGGDELQHDMDRRGKQEPHGISDSQADGGANLETSHSGKGYIGKADLACMQAQDIFDEELPDFQEDELNAALKVRSVRSTKVTLRHIASVAALAANEYML
jgi:hypothetical protein